MNNEIKVYKSWEVNSEYCIKWQSRLPDKQYLEQHQKYLIQDFCVLPWQSELSEERKSKMKNLKDRLSDKFWIRLALFYKNQMVGWSYGWQDSIHPSDFYMAGSLILPDHRRKGLYSEMIKRVLSITKEEGFSRIRSRHICTNNPILIAKLKLGFFINGFEQDETIGTVIRMVYHHDDLRRKAAYFRAGKMDESDVYYALTS